MNRSFSREKLSEIENLCGTNFNETLREAQKPNFPPTFPRAMGSVPVGASSWTLLLCPLKCKVWFCSFMAIVYAREDCTKPHCSRGTRPKHMENMNFSYSQFTRGQLWFARVIVRLKVNAMLEYLLFETCVHVIAWHYHEPCSVLLRFCLTQMLMLN